MDHILFALAFILLSFAGGVLVTLIRAAAPRRARPAGGKDWSPSC